MQGNLKNKPESTSNKIFWFTIGAILIGSVSFYSIKTHLSFTHPEAVYGLDNPKTRDNQKIKDIKFLQAALENYYNVNSRYPETLNALAITLPVASKSDSPCLGKDYDYKTLVKSGNKQSSYELKFCLERSFTGYEAGDHLALPTGIQ